MPTYLNPINNPAANPHIDLMNLIRKWNITYDGRNDAVAFLERVEELAEQYAINHNHLVRALPELLRGQAILWYRSQKQNIGTWDDFKFLFQTFFFPREYHEDLEEELGRRVQQQNESGRDFVVNVQTLIRRHGGWNTERELNCIYRHLQTFANSSTSRADNQQCIMLEMWPKRQS